MCIARAADQATPVCEAGCVCAGNQVSEAYAYTDCYASAFAEITAHALARAYVDAKCWPYGEDAVAFAEAKASVDIDVTETYACKFTTGTTGTGGTTVGGGAGTFVVRPTNSPVTGGPCQKLFMACFLVTVV